MTESIKTAIKAINKWVFFGWNYQCIQHEWVVANGDRRTVPCLNFWLKYGGLVTLTTCIRNGVLLSMIQTPIPIL